MSGRSTDEGSLDTVLAGVREDLVRSPGAVDVPRIARVLRAQGREIGRA